MFASPITAYKAAVDKIERMMNEMINLVNTGIIKNSNTPNGFLQYNQDLIKKILDELIEFIKTPATGYAALDSYITHVMGIQCAEYTRRDGRCMRLVLPIWNNYSIPVSSDTGYIGWVRSFHTIAIKSKPDVICDTTIKRYLDSLKCVIDPHKYDLRKIYGDISFDNLHIHSAFVVARSLIESFNEVNVAEVKALVLENRSIRKQLSDNEVEIKSLVGENQLLREQSNANHLVIQHLKSKIETIERKISPELIEYDYDEIKSRLDPIRSEMKIVHRVFSRLIANSYAIPMATPVVPK